MKRWIDIGELKHLLGLMLPLYVANLMHVGMGVIDTIVAGAAGPGDLAAVALGSSVVTPILVAFGAVLTIVGPMVSRLRGAGAEGKVGLLLNNAKVLAVGLMLAEAVLIYAGGFIMPLVTDDAVLADTACRYMYFMMLGIPASVMLRAVQGNFEGYGQTRPAMAFALLGLVVNIPLNYMFVFGWGSLPALGGAGCGLATAIIHWLILLGMLGIMYVSRQHRRNCRQMFASRRPDAALCRRIFLLGLPVGVASLCEMSFFCVVMLVMAPLGEMVLSAQQVAINVSGVAFMLPFSLGVAASIRAAYHVGSGRKEAFDALVRTVCILTAVLIVIMMVLCALLRHEIVALYTESEQVRSLAQYLILLCCCYQIPDATQALFAGLLRGCHDTQIITWVNMGSYWLVGFPLACILIRTDWLVPAMGAAGAWVSFIVSLSIAAVLFVLRFIRTRRRIFSTPTL